MKHTLAYCFLALGFLAGCRKDEPSPATLPASVNAGGATTISGHFSSAFEQPSANLNAAQIQMHTAGNRAFEQSFVTAGGSPVFAGIGPLFNQTACVVCHGKNGSAPFPQSGDDLGGLLLRISIPGVNLNGGPLAVPGFGDQLQQRATFGVNPEAQVSMQLQTEIRQFLDGEQIGLRRPIFVLIDPYLPLPGNMLLSPRIAPPVIGLGLLEAIRESDILAGADEQDADADGISGKPNWVWDVAAQHLALGRFGWKASQPNLRQQAAAAFNGDMGITTSYFPSENCIGQVQCDSIGDDPEIDDDFLQGATFYTQSLAVPARRDWDLPQVQQGEKLFQDAGCAKCHRPSFTTGHAEFDFLSGQQIFAYTDLLLHDMGEGLADNRPDYAASGREWRTPPLWGIGLTELVNGHTDFLHDGRARNLTEAILWHGGEGETAKERFRTMSKNDRNALLAFLRSL